MKNENINNINERTITPTISAKGTSTVSEVKPIEQIRQELNAARANITQDEIDFIREGVSQAEAVSALKRIRATNGILESADGYAAELSRTRADKLISNSACGRSIENGFTREQHYAAAADIDNLYANSKMVSVLPDKDNDPNMERVYRFLAPLSNDDVVYITVKKPTGHNNTMYSVELIELGKLAPGVNEVARSITSLGHGKPPNNIKIINNS